MTTVVLTPVTSPDDYTTWAAVKTYLDITGTGDDALGALLVNRVTDAIDRYCRRRFRAVTATRTFDVPEGDTLFLDDDLLSITTLTNGDGNVVTSASYVLLPKNNLPKYAIRLKENASTVWEGSTTTDYQAISIAGSWGYSMTPADDIVQAAVRWTAWLYRQRDGAFGQTARPDIGVIETPLALPVDIERLLKPYKRWRVGAS
jgi:hypothetical protein